MQLRRILQRGPPPNPQAHASPMIFLLHVSLIDIFRRYPYRRSLYHVAFATNVQFAAFDLKEMRHKFENSVTTIDSMSKHHREAPAHH